MATPIPADDRRSLTLRLSVMQYGLAAAFVALAVGFWFFQIAQYQQFLEIANNQYMQRVPLPAPRGLLFDRHGAVLVQNQEISNILLHRERVKNMDRTLQAVADATGADLAELRETVERRRHDPPFRPIVLIENATFAQVVAVRARSLELPGVADLPVPTRRYAGNSRHTYSAMSGRSHRPSCSDPSTKASPPAPSSGSPEWSRLTTIC